MPPRLRAWTRREALAELPDLSRDALGFICFRHPRRELKSILLEEILNPGGYGGEPASLTGFWTEDPAFAEIRRQLSTGEIRLSFKLGIIDGAPYELEWFSGRSEEHKAYCAATAWWIEKHWPCEAPDPGIKWRFKWVSDAIAPALATLEAGRADVVASDLSLAAECGFVTSPRKVVASTNAGRSVLIVPYRHTVKLNRAVGFLFQPGRAWKRLREARERAERDAAFAATSGIGL